MQRIVTYAYYTYFIVQNKIRGLYVRTVALWFLNVTHSSGRLNSKELRFKVERKFLAFIALHVVKEKMHIDWEA